MFGIWSGMDHEYQTLHPHRGHGPFSFSHIHPHPVPYLPTTQSNCSILHVKEDLGHVQVLTSEAKFFVKLDTTGYSPEELEIKTLNGFLVIQGETVEKGGDGFKIKRKFRRRFLLPVNCKEDELTCELGGIRDDDTILKVTIPRDVPDGKGKLHRIAVSGMGVHPRHVTRSYPASHEHGLNADSVAGVECNREQFVLRLGVPRFSPDELVVKTVDDFLVVEGDHGEREEGGVGAFASCFFSHRYLLPVNADVAQIVCEINEEGRLKVIVPRINSTKTEQEKVHKIERQKGGTSQ